MNAIGRRAGLGAALALPLLSRYGAAQSGLTRIRFTLDWRLQGVHAWFYLARERGYFRDAGLDVVIDQGEGSAAAVTRVMSGAYDAGFGDITAVIVAAAQNPAEAPRIVYEMYNRGPYAVVVRADSPVRTLRDLEGRSVGAPAGSASARLFPALLRLNGIDPSRVTLSNVAANLQEPMLQRGALDGILGHNYSIYINLPAVGLDPDRDARWLTYAENGLDIYCNGVIASPKLMRENPGAVRGLLAGINRAVREGMADPDAAIRSLRAVEPLLDAEVEKRRLLYTVRNVMLTPFTAAEGFGGVEPRLLDHTIRSIAEAFALPRVPAAAEVFDGSFLPPQDARRFGAVG
ncbi:ABC transporter substrate-binding protein (plasmid) [Roseomonas sp. CCTCC AB2023176]|uniref:ABC transporter substrate-binding protein n=1 Tax=Roseomonas sp. CCTCC AB2023176 TaxID=3342640 RepID=UPI0035D8C56E